MKIFLDGQIIDAEQAVISPFDHGFLYGLGLFETMRVYNGHVALLERHYRRLSEAAEEIGIAVTMTREELRFAILQTLNANQLKDAYIRVDLTAGNGALGPFAGIYENPRWLIFARPLPDFPEHFYQTGKKLQTLKRPRNTPEGTWRFKSHHYMNNRLAKREVGASLMWKGFSLQRTGAWRKGLCPTFFS
ncbi:aminotransferase class IV [Aneurinibacillus tyrosinisolvens]|uniref:aminotransferase class IV n=1 Tax=Aneurinibacillus tyrosinisolvens TaxID=1443435 RepID=UPI000699F1D2